MPIIEYLLEHYDIDDLQDIQAHVDEILSKFGRDDIVELANIVVVLANVPEELFSKLYEHM